MKRKSRLSIEEVMTSFGTISKTNDPNVYIQKERLDRNPIEYPFALDHYSILIISTGDCRVRVNFRDYHLQKDQLLMSPPNCIFHFLSFDEELAFKIISFSQRLIDEMGVYRNHSDQFKFLAFKYPSVLSMDAGMAFDIYEIVNLLDKKVNSEAIHPFKREINLHTLAVLMFEVSAALKDSLEIKANQLSRRESLVTSFLELVHHHFSREHAVGFYADKLAVTPNYLSKTTKAEVGRSASEIIEDMLVLEANMLLRQPGISVSQVADMLSFSDQFVFSKFFKRKTSRSPSIYRKT